MTITPIANASGTGSSTTATTSAVDTTGANYIAIAYSWFGGGTPTVFDNKGNSPTATTKYSNASGGNIQVAYFEAPTVGSGHTFTIASGGSAIYPAICMQALDGVASSALDQQNGAITDGSSINTGSVTPTDPNEVLLTALIKGLSGTNSIDSGFTISNQIDYVGAGNMGCSLAYKIQTTAGAENPQWSWSGTDTYCAATILTFKAAAGGGGAETKTVTADLNALLNKQGLIRQATANALLNQQGVTRTASGNALLNKVGVVRSAVANALLKVQGLIQQATANAYLKKIQSISADAGALLLKSQALTASADAILGFFQTISTSANALLNKTGITRTASADALLNQQGITKTASANAYLKKVLSLSASAGAVLLKPLTRTVAAGALLVKSQAVTAGADAILAIIETITRTLQASGNALLYTQRTLSASAASYISKTGALEASANAYLHKDGVTLQCGADAILFSAISAPANRIYRVGGRDNFSRVNARETPRA